MKASFRTSVTCEEKLRGTIVNPLKITSISQHGKQIVNINKSILSLNKHHVLLSTIIKS